MMRFLKTPVTWIVIILIIILLFKKGVFNKLFSAISTLAKTATSSVNGNGITRGDVDAAL